MFTNSIKTNSIKRNKLLCVISVKSLAMKFRQFQMGTVTITTNKSIRVSQYNLLMGERDIPKNGKVH